MMKCSTCYYKTNSGRCSKKDNFSLIIDCWHYISSLEELEEEMFGMYIEEIDDFLND